MDKDRFREILDLLGWGQNEVARLLHRDSREIRRWASGRNPIDPEAAAWLEMQAANPPPLPPWLAGASQ
jgi:plasmid maintenance system antidote protein VapI